MSGNLKEFIMKKFLIIFSVIFVILATTCLEVLADAHWAEPKNIKTYVPQHAKKELMKQAFSAWTRATKGKIVFKYVNNPKDADIKVDFVKDIYDVTGNKTTIGQTYHKSLGPYMVSAVITISDRAPNGAAFRKDAVYRVMVHEIGHALGWFGHSQSTDSIMYYAKVNRNATITQKDIEYIEKLYGWD